MTFPDGASLRDTVEVNFLVTCVSGLRIITRAIGASSGSYANVYLCTDPYCDGLPFYLGRVGTNDTLVFKAETDTYRVGITVANRNCVAAQDPPDPIQFVRGTTVDVTFQITCT